MDHKAPFILHCMQHSCVTDIGYLLLQLNATHCSLKKTKQNTQKPALNLATYYQDLYLLLLFAFPTPQVHVHQLKKKKKQHHYLYVFSCLECFLEYVLKT